MRKNISKMKGELTLFDELRYHYYITTRTDLSAADVVRKAHQRCDQENLIAQLKGGVDAMRVPLYDLESNWAYMVIPDPALGADFGGSGGWSMPIG